MLERRVILAALLGVLCAGSAPAVIQETWISPVIPAPGVTSPPVAPRAAKKPKVAPKPAVKAPGRPMVVAGDSGIVELTLGAKFPQGEAPIPKERLDRSLVRLGAGRPFPLTGARIEDKVTKLDATYVLPGTATIGVQLAPTVMERKGPEFQAYLAEIAASAAQADRAQKKETKKAAREVNIATAKAFAGVFDPSGRLKPETGAPSPSEPLELPLEFTVEGDPLNLRSGGSVSVVLLQNKQPVANQPVRVYHNPGEPEVIQTDGSGRASLASLKEGRLLLAATTIRRLSKDDKKKKGELYKKADWESVSTSLHLEVLAAAPVAPPTPTPKGKRKKR